MNPEKVWRKLQAGHFANIAFGDLVALLRELGFELDHISGSHHIFRHATLAVRVNLQPDQSGDAKTYQARQVLMEAKANGLSLRSGRQ
ncbi:type II toxin-antitoxin system HicA family toxin [Niveispirillum sp.]|uniref:type II toxin-antitoxin system HicA family toxin n=1 Tax=Niveispirillum sp. TaxID=1917217 RepID=UPI001B597640|nr:type II toxin-antitoxin system HicA family toxin [Niveispirillum sp.]MBP7337754.1 type II toxin-antitoxin system HicA family toxin [Niveispirillum sp.]